MRLNIGDAGVELPGFRGFDIRRGEDASAPLPFDDGTIEVIRASHVLEHFPHGDVIRILRDWVRCLEPGGELRLSVPDFGLIAEQYVAGADFNVQGFVMGGQTDAHDFHKTLFDRDLLAATMVEAGLVAIRPWSGSGEDTASSNISLNLAGTKPPAEWPKVAAVLSCPRLGFNDFWGRALGILAPLGIPFEKVTGAYWDRDLTIAIDRVIERESPDWILTLDYDSIFTRDQVLGLLDIVRRRSNIDALAPLQAARHHDKPMFTASDPETGEPVTRIRRDDLVRGEVCRADSAHFGLTLLRTAALQELPRPWFERRFTGPGVENPTDHDYGVDPDVGFWQKWKAEGRSLYIALRIPIGHAEVMVRWPDRNLDATLQRPDEFRDHGVPAGVWR